MSHGMGDGALHGMDSPFAYRRLFTSVRDFLEHISQRERFALKWTIDAAPQLSILGKGSKAWITDSLAPLAFFTVVIVCAASILIYRIGDEAYEQHYRLTGTIIEALILIAVAIFNIWLVNREAIIRHQELKSRLLNILDRFRPLESTYALSHRHYSDLHHVSSSTSYQVIACKRDGKVVGVPANLLVEGDVIYLSVGDRAPARIRRVPAHHEEDEEHREDKGRDVLGLFKSAAHKAHLSRHRTTTAAVPAHGAAAHVASFPNLRELPQQAVAAATAAATAKSATVTVSSTKSARGVRFSLEDIFAPSSGQGGAAGQPPVQHQAASALGSTTTVNSVAPSTGYPASETASAILSAAPLPAAPASSSGERPHTPSAAPAHREQTLPSRMPPGAHLGSPGDRTRMRTTFTLEQGQVFSAAMEHQTPQSSFATSTEPHGRCRFIVDETPLISYLKSTFELTRERPPTTHTTLRRLVSTLVQRCALVLYLVSLAVNVIRVLVLRDDVGTWMEMVFLLPIYTILPCLPVLVPSMWIFANHYASARVLAMFFRGKVSPVGGKDEDNDSLDSWDEEVSQAVDAVVHTPKTMIWQFFREIVQGASSHMTRTTNLVHVLSTMSVMAFVDKQGIISEATPVPAKVFMLGQKDTERFEREKAEKAERAERERLEREAAAREVAELEAAERAEREAAERAELAQAMAAAARDAAERKAAERAARRQSRRESEEKLLAALAAKDRKTAEDLEAAIAALDNLDSEGEGEGSEGSEGRKTETKLPSDKEAAHQETTTGDDAEKLLPRSTRDGFARLPSLQVQDENGAVETVDVHVHVDGHEPSDITVAVGHDTPASDEHSTPMVVTAADAESEYVEIMGAAAPGEDGGAANSAVSNASSSAARTPVPVPVSLLQPHVQVQEPAEQGDRSAHPRMEEADGEIRPVSPAATTTTTTNNNTNTPGVAKPTPTASKGNEDGDSVFLSEQEEQAPAVKIELKLIRDDGSPSHMRFEHHVWEDHVNSLKPLGLNMLLNNHCLTNDHGRKLAEHIAFVDERERGNLNYLQQSACRSTTRLQPCLCRLAATIGFETGAVESFALRQQLVTVAPFHHSLDRVRNRMGSSEHMLDTDGTGSAAAAPAAPAAPAAHHSRPGSCQYCGSIDEDMRHFDVGRARPRAQSTSAPSGGVQQKKKDFSSDARVLGHLSLPFMRSTVVEAAGDPWTAQLFTAGTGELIQENCASYWNGQGIETLTPADRQAILDFYYTASASMVCYAFAYRPIYRSSGAAEHRRDFHTVYLDLPPCPGSIERHLTERSASLEDALGGNGASNSGGGLADTQSLHARTETSKSPTGQRSLEIALDESFNNNASQADTISVHSTKSQLVVPSEGRQAGGGQAGHGGVQQHSQAHSQSGVLFTIGAPTTQPVFARSSSEHAYRSSASASQQPSQQTLLAAPVPPPPPSSSPSASVAHLQVQPAFHYRPGPTLANIVSTLREIQGPNSHSSGDLVGMDETNNSVFNDYQASATKSDRQHMHSTHVALQNSHYRLQHDQIFLGLVAVRDRAVPDITQLIHDLTDGGIRFVYFSAEDELQSKAFAEEVGLETGWNCYISLSDDGRGPEAYEEKSKLPRGVEHIRSHLDNTDDVPLLVPLFSDCSPAATAEMITIMQERDKVVCCIGSCLNAINTPIFARANVSISIDPLRDARCLWPNGKLPVSLTTLKPGERSIRIPNLSAEDLSGHLTSLPCSLRMPRHADISLITMTREARKLNFNVGMCFGFLLWSYVTMALLMIATQILFLPPIFNGIQLLWMQCVTVPLMAAPLLMSPAEPGLMKLLMGRAKEHRRQFTSHARNFCVRFVPSCAILVAIFVITLQEFCEYVRDERGLTYECHPLLGPRGTHPYREHTWNGFSSDQLQALSLAQNIVCWLLILFLALISSGFLHFTLPYKSYTPLRNPYWISGAVIAVLLQSVFFAVSNVAVNHSTTSVTLRDVPVASIVLACLWPFCIVAITVYHKAKVHRKAVRMQKRARLEFDTKLGMHSPV